MDNNMHRRSFLIAAPAAVGALTHVANNETTAPRAPAEVKISETAYAPADYPIQAKRFSEVTIKDTFWKPKLDTNAQVTIPFEVRKLSEGGRGFGGNVLEASILSLQTHPDAQLQAQVDARVRAISAQTAVGNRGFEVAVAYYFATGKRDLLEPAIRSAEALHQDFKVNNPPFSGGERDALNCIQLYRATGDRKHLDLAKHYLDIRGLPNSVGRSRHNQSYKPVLEQSEAVGHAVNCVTLMLSMVDVGILTGIKDYFNAGQRMWQDAVRSKLYITGGVGSTGNEGFGEPYSLPNIDAYSETCAVLMFMTLSHRLFLATGDSKYIDVLERGMYNNAIDGVSVSGDHFFYVNRLASAGDGRDHRWQRASLECCPPNLVRFMAGMPGYVYAQDRNGAVYVNLYMSSEAAFKIAARDLALSVASEMPWGGKSKITISTREDVKSTIKLRIPGWAANRVVPSDLYSCTDRLTRQATVAVNGKPVSANADRLGYVSLDRLWKNGDVVDIEFPVEVRKVIANERVKEDRRKMAIERGPIVYCAEWPDVASGRVLDLQFDANAELKPVVDNNLYGGVTVLDTQARRMGNSAAASSPVRLIPYYLWANRGPGEMSVWLSTAPYAVGDTGPAGGIVFYENPNYATDGWRFLEAAPFDQSAGAQWGCFRREIPGARGTAIGTGKQNTADMLAACAEPGTAAHLCANFSLNGVKGWFLPSRDELAAMYRNLRAAGAGNFQDCGTTDNFTYWASTQNTADMAAHIDFPDNGRLHGDDKDFPRRVRAIRAF